jgi:hypothetical protein
LHSQLTWELRSCFARITTFYFEFPGKDPILVSI